jgi:hypothetical protein
MFRTEYGMSSQIAGDEIKNVARIIWDCHPAANPEAGWSTYFAAQEAACRHHCQGPSDGMSAAGENGQSEPWQQA